MLSHAQILEVHSILDRENPESYPRAVNKLLSFHPEGKGKQVSDKTDRALAYLTAYLQSLLDDGNYVEAALFLWGPRTFDVRPRSVKRIWEAIQKHDKLLCMGSGVQGKSYTATVWMFLRWLEDPEYTSVKLVSTTSGHLKSNVYGGFVKLHKESAIPLPGVIRDDYIGLRVGEKISAIEKVSISKDDTGTAALRGLHRLPRKEPHPKFGDMSVVILLMDEADDIPAGAWIGADNLASGRGDQPGSIKIYAATNPRKRESEFAQRAEPREGWSWVDRDKTFEWNGRQGWYVIRLDARQSENFKERREVYQGLMTYEAAKAYLDKGSQDAAVATFVWGLYPTQAAHFYIVPAFITDNIVGTYNFIKTPFNVASFDPAFEEGGDDPTVTAGRYGMVNGWRPANGQMIAIPDRMALQVDQQFDLQKKENPIRMADDLIVLLRKLNILPEWFAHDQTGNATLLYGYLLIKYGAVLGLKWGSGATETKIFEEDKETCDEQFSGLVSEMWFGFSRWAQFDYIKISPMMQTTRLFKELNTRKYEQVGKSLQRAQSKQDWKDENTMQSCDPSDSLIMLSHLCRIRGIERAKLIHAQEEQKMPVDVWRGEGFNLPNRNSLPSTVDKIPFLQFDD